MQPTVQIKLAPYAINAGAWDDPGSYQAQALQRTEEQIGAESMTDSKLVQYYTLYCIYTATNGVANNITNDDPRFDNIAIPQWLFENGWNENDVDPCTGSWYGIACSNDQVIGIDLSSNVLTGIFPPEVSFFSTEHPSGAGSLRALVLLKNEFLYSEDNSWIADLGSNLCTFCAYILCAGVSDATLTPTLTPTPSLSQLSDSVFPGDFPCGTVAKDARKLVRV